MPTSILPAALREIDARRICLIKPSALGDVAQTLPLLAPLRRRFPDAEISWVVNRELSGLLEGHPELHEVIPFDRHGSPRSAWRLLRRLREGRFDLTIDLQGLLRSGFMTWATGARARIGLETAREGAQLAYHGMIPDSGRDIPAYARYWRLAEALGQGSVPRQAIVSYGPSDRNWVRDRLWGLPRPFVAVHPGARWETKRWPADSFAEVAARVCEQFSGSIVVIGGHGDWKLGSQITEVVTARRGRVINLAGHTSLKGLAALLQQVDLLVSNDSGPLHLGAELGTPVVGVYTCTSPRISGPSGSHQALIGTEEACAASYHRRCPRRAAGHLACLQEVTPDRVWRGVLKLLQERPVIVRSA
jgi:lipopolysaccharide heptosyltransferase II